ncbi:hypothetical protein [Saliphagus infecundisoli]|uniref:Uncharacterized protein n=1 Tax=Saliphagus infecundisoli TaxID=1849069 RepID=A0ABD5QAS3_9EURY|nr:hypothetical protein [Saliphagus infecundisoli]
MIKVTRLIPGLDLTGGPDVFTVELTLVDGNLGDHLLVSILSVVVAGVLRYHLGIRSAEYRTPGIPIMRVLVGDTSYEDHLHLESEAR